MSISGMAQMRPSTEFESGSPGLTRKLSRDTDFMPSSLPTDTSMFGNGVVKRRACEGKQGMCFGRDLGLAGRTCGVYDAADERIGESDYQRRRRQCLPAVAIRCVEYRKSGTKDLADKCSRTMGTTGGRNIPYQWPQQPHCPSATRV